MVGLGVGVIGLGRRLEAEEEEEASLDLTAGKANEREQSTAPISFRKLTTSNARR